MHGSARHADVQPSHGWLPGLGQLGLDPERGHGLVYDGTTNKLTSVGNVDPLFGTEGRPVVPEPGTAGLLGLGFLGLGLMGRRRR